MSSRSRSLSAVLAVLALLFAQMMASVHACDVSSPQAPVAVGGGQDGPADCCDQGSPAPDPLCDNHCQQGKQVPERTQAATITPPLISGTVVPGFAVAFAPYYASLPAAPDLARDTEPAITIRNCCFRI